LFYLLHLRVKYSDMTKNILIALALFLSLGNVFSQNQATSSTGPKLSGTQMPSQQWEEWFNKEVKKFKEQNLAGKTQFGHYTVPVIFHIIHNGIAAGTPPNIPASRVDAQLAIMNQVFGGNGANPTSITHYSAWATNPNIEFCLALNNPTNIPLAEPGINRVDLGALLGINTATIATNNDLLALIEYTVKPAIIWDPTKYLNIFVSETSTSVTVLGSATFPAGTALVGLTPAIGTGTNDGVWVSTKVVGTASATPGPYEPNYDKGKTLCREIGHWLGVRNIWGDANCGTDYCFDTPPHSSPNYDCPAGYPHKQNSCGNQLSPMGEMSMNIMDYTYDDCRYMFTSEQVIRMQSAMSQCPFRALLGTHALCTATIPCGSPAIAIAQFSFAAPPCFGTAFTPVNFSTGCPAPTFSWVLTPNTATVTNGYFAPMPSFNLSSQGSYTLELTATNSVGTTYQTYTFSTANCPKGSICLDSLDKIKNTDTLSVYGAPTSTSIIGCNVTNPGFLTGTNCYNDKEYAQYYAGSTYSNITSPQLSAVYVLFNRKGTVSTSGNVNVSCNIWGGNLQGGPVTQLIQNPVQLSLITATTAASWSTCASPVNNVPWCGQPSYSFAANDIYAFKYLFNPPYVIPGGGFHVGIEMPWTSIVDSVQIFSNSLTNAPVADSAAFVRTQTNNWYKLFKWRGKNVQLAIIPEITCRAPVGVAENVNGISNSVKLIPNPSNGVFSILTTFETGQDLTFKVFNYMGQQIGENKENNVTLNSFEFNLSNNSNGVYFIEVSNGREKTVKKVIVTK